MRMLRWLAPTLPLLLLASCSHSRPDCAFALSASLRGVPSAGGTGLATVTPSPSTPGCSWKASSDASWLLLSGTLSGTRESSFSYTAAPNPASTPRTGTVIIEWTEAESTQATITITQSGPIALSQTTQAAPASGGDFSFTVSASPSASVASDAPWLTVLSSTAGTSGTIAVSYRATANDASASRTGHIVVTDGASSATLTVTQAASEFISVDPAFRDVLTAGGTFSTTVTTTGAWTATRDVPWITFSGPNPSSASGSGNATLSYVVAQNTGSTPRTGTITVTTSNGSDTHVVNQSGACGISLSPPAQSVPAGASSQTVSVTATNCPSWTATVSGASPWITNASPATGSGNGSISYSVQANPGAQRSGTISVSAGGFTATLTVTQVGPAGCVLTVNPTSQSISFANASLQVTVNASNCPSWQATVEPSAATWLSITSGSTGSGNGTITWGATANTGPPRVGRINVTAGSTTATLTITQAANCTLGLNPTFQSMPPNASKGSFSVIAANCANWTASAVDPWLAIASGTSGTGNGSTTIAYTTQLNTGAARSGQIRVTSGSISQTFTVNQQSGIITPDLQVSPTVTPPGPNTCVLDNTPFLQYTIRCRFDASASAPQAIITGYLFQLVLTPTDVRTLGSGVSSVITNPVIGCVISNLPPNTQVSLPVKITLTVAPGFTAPPPLQKNVLFVRTLAC
jgi:hypothetical protein